ncbi:MAG: class I SAM-dependent methyltransferase, partial [Verrucomicrobia bacterium]|nr:class I SAM-dependent methyltransferase [Verrucomicrobiota bacterium]
MKKWKCLHCPLCGSEGGVLYAGLKDRLFGVPGESSFRQCNKQDCGLIWQDPMPVPEDLGSAYARYYTHTDAGKRTGLVLCRLARLPAHAIDALLIRLLGIRKQRKKMRYLGLMDMLPGHLLEIGCGRGTKLCMFKNLGWQVVGQEIDPEAAAYVKNTYGFDILCGELLSFNLEENSYDAIVMSHVLEHVPDVTTVLRESHRLLKPGGRLVLTTPNSESFAHQKFRENWRGLEPPRHLHIFSKRSLEVALRQSGFWKISVATNAANARGIFEVCYQMKNEPVLRSDFYPR